MVPEELLGILSGANGSSYSNMIVVEVTLIRLWWHHSNGNINISRHVRRWDSSRCNPLRCNPRWNHRWWNSSRWYHHHKK